MATTAEHAGLLTVTVATTVGVVIVGGAEEGRGAVLETVALVLWVAWVRLGRPRRAARRASGPAQDAAPAPATPGQQSRMTLDDCITVLFIVAVAHTALRYLVSAETGDGALMVSAVVAIYLVWIYFGTRWLERRKGARTPTAS